MDFTQQQMTPMPTVLPSTSNSLFGDGQAAQSAPFLTQLAQMLQSKSAQNSQQPQQQGSVGGMPSTSGWNPNGMGAQAASSMMPTSTESPLAMLMSLFSGL